MPAYPEQYPGDLQALATELMKLRQQVDALRSQPARIPVVDADPPAGDTTNIWLFADGRLRWRKPSGVIAEFVPTGTPGGTSSTVAKPVVTQPKTYSTVFPATWSAAYRGDGTKRTDDPSGLYFGWNDAANGRQKTLIGFDQAAIASALTGAAIKGVDLWLNVRDSPYTRVTARFATHTNTSAPATYGGQHRRNVSLRDYTPPQGKWVSLSTMVGEWLKAGTIKGVGIVQASDAPSEYGVALGFGSADPPLLRLTYVK